MNFLKALWDDEAGASAVEYAIIASLIAAVIAATVGILGGQIFTLFSSVNWWQ